MGKITKEIAQRIIDEFCAGQSTYDLAKNYDLWQTSICNAIAGRSWSQCKRPENIKELSDSRREKNLFKKGRTCYIDAPPITNSQMDILIGSMLGDGSVKTGLCNHSFTKKQCKKFKEYLEWHHQALMPYSSRTLPVYSKQKPIVVNGEITRRKVKKYISGYNFYTHQHPTFTNLRTMWYPNGKKIIPSNLILNEQRIAIWYFDDGSNHVPSRTAVICTQSFTVEEADFLCQKFHKFDIKPSITKIVSKYTGREMPILKFTKSSYDNLIHIITPYCLWDCLKYKVNWRPAKKQWEYSGKFTRREINEIIEDRKIKSAKQIAQERGVHVNTIYAIISGRSWKHL